LQGTFEWTTGQLFPNQTAQIDIEHVTQAWYSAMQMQWCLRYEMTLEADYNTTEILKIPVVLL
jgi:hypothetical protein